MTDHGYGADKANWIVMLHFHGKPAAEALRTRQPSFFATSPAASICPSQVNVINTPIYAKRYCMLLTFSGREPTGDQVKSAVSGLREVLSLKRQTRVVTTTPFPRQKEEIFRADGDIAKPSKDNVLQPRLRAALSSMDGLASSGTVKMTTAVPHDLQKRHVNL